MKQLGFDLDWADPYTQGVSGFLAFDATLIAQIKAAPWKIVDTETTGLTPASKQVNLSGKEIRRGFDGMLRCRVLTVRAVLGGTLKTVSFDFDRMTDSQRSLAAAAALTNTFIAHNAGFDLYWLRQYAKVMPTLVIDTLVLLRLLRPEVPVLMAKRIVDENETDDFRMHAKAMFMAGRSGWSLADLSAALLRRIMSKTRQKPKNWAEPLLTSEHFRYATGDVDDLHDLLVDALELNGQGDDLLMGYMDIRTLNPQVARSESIVPNIVRMREKGVPINALAGELFIKEKRKAVEVQAALLMELLPDLAADQTSKRERLGRELAKFEGGVSAELRHALGECFEERGLFLERTAGPTDTEGMSLETLRQKQMPKVGEKDLRKARAAQYASTKGIFDAWAGLSKAKKAGNMAKEVIGYAVRSVGMRIHPLTGIGPVTGRLSSAEPNCQQWPKEQGFRDMCEARPGYLILASDYSALDMRVGAALAIRAQYQILAFIRNGVGSSTAPVELVTLLGGVLRDPVEAVDRLKVESDEAREAYARIKEQQAPADKTAKSAYFQDLVAKRDASKHLRLAYCFAVCRQRAVEKGAETWGSLRDAFDLAGMDIHTWTALAMTGENPSELFREVKPEDLKGVLEKWKKKLGSVRQTGKVGNLSLLYAMTAMGLQEAAAKNYDIHWTLEEAETVRNDWLASYPEIELWHLWTDVNKLFNVKLPDVKSGRPHVLRNTGVYASRTLAERLIYAFGLNAALSYEDQSSGADIMADVMETLRVNHPDIFECVINQVHDELVLELPEEREPEYTAIVHRVMVECAEKLTMLYGVHCECSPAVGRVWLKD